MQVESLTVVFHELIYHAASLFSFLPMSSFVLQQVNFSNCNNYTPRFYLESTYMEGQQQPSLLPSLA